MWIDNGLVDNEEKIYKIRKKNKFKIQHVVNQLNSINEREETYTDPKWLRQIPPD